IRPLPLSSGAEYLQRAQRESGAAAEHDVRPGLAAATGRPPWSVREGRHADQFLTAGSRFDRCSLTCRSSVTCSVEVLHDAKSDLELYRGCASPGWRSRTLGPASRER